MSFVALSLLLNGSPAQAMPKLQSLTDLPPTTSTLVTTFLRGYACCCSATTRHRLWWCRRLWMVAPAARRLTSR